MAKRVSDARLAAYDVLRDVADRDAYANLSLPAKIEKTRLSTRDVAFVTELVSGTLRMQGYYDAVISIAAQRDSAQIDPRTLRVLRLGAHQLLATRVAAHAAINESVELQRLVSNAKATGFVNGVLRTIERTDGARWQELVREAQGTVDEQLAAAYSHPEWVVRQLRDALNVDGRGTELIAMLEANNESPQVNLALLPDGERSAEQLCELAQQELGEEHIIFTGTSPHGAVLRRISPLAAISRLRERGIIACVQDQGSQLAALALVAAKPVSTGEKWLDLCAGPGGKTALLAAHAKIAGAHVRATEVTPHRAALVRRATQDFGDTVDVVCADGRSERAYAGQKYDRILIDAPCSGLGALRRRPEARWRKQPSDIPALTKLQEQLITAAVPQLNSGGVLAYVTCSPHLAETKAVVKRILRQNTQLRQLPTGKILADISPVLQHDREQPVTQLWPHRDGTDAMFIVLFELAQ
ncbi:rRNA small subunit methyltransferase B [Canibacter sp. lx-45]|uniref:RsmB/NOP family class I SAM-dependent RNA methyltransferase n=1 Tax=Canibacter zhuwentaonis TaxID=2837491 RepID=UPI001BDBECE3|nr:transcription antitermination factor NusB [Canibacter zhuwentaonis]MBT1035280.1 rRNA small subunit methyltransferase B [Canibacter zhuwentaonis]